MATKEHSFAKNPAIFFLAAPREAELTPGSVGEIAFPRRAEQRSNFPSRVILRDFSRPFLPPPPPLSAAGESRKFRRASREAEDPFLQRRPPAASPVCPFFFLGIPPPRRAISFYSHRRLIHGPDTGYPYGCAAKVLPALELRRSTLRKSPSGDPDSAPGCVFRAGPRPDGE